MTTLTLGQKLRHARDQKGVSLDDAARATRIRAIRLAEIEHDVYANCPSATYARGFVVIYGEFLGVDVRPHLHEFDVSGAIGLDDYQYLSHTPVADGPKDARKARELSRANGAGQRFAALATAAIFLLLAGFGYVVYVNYSRLGDLDRLHARQNGLAPADDTSPATALGSAGTPDAAAAPVVAAPAAATPVVKPAPIVPPRIYPRRGEQGLRNAIVRPPLQPRPDPFE